MRRLWTAVAAATALACGAPSTAVTVPDRKLPRSFGANETSGEPRASSASLSWRQYFSDQQLSQLIERAIEGNSDLKIALQRIEIARAGVRYASGLLLPEVRVGVGVGVEKFGLYTAEGAGNVGTSIAPGRTVPTHVPDFALGLQASWEVDAWGRLSNLRDAALAEYLASVEGTHLVLSTLVTDVASAYFELLALESTRRVLTETLERQRRTLEVMRIQKDAGRTNELAVQQFASQLVDTEASAAQMRDQIREKEAELHLLMGQYPGTLPRGTETPFTDALARVAVGAPSELLLNRPDIRQAEQQLRATKCDLKAARAAFFPTLTMSAGAGFRAFDPRFLFSTPDSVVYSATAGLVAPLVNKSAIEAEFATAKAHQIEAMYNYQKVVLQAYTEALNSLARIYSAQDVAALKREQKRLTLQAVEASDLLFRAGKASYLEVLMAEQNALSVDLELIEAESSLRLAGVSFYKAVGGGWR